MLYKDPFLIAPDTLALIGELQGLPDLKGFYLVGGTALALQLGHRNSIDIDLFTQEPFDSEKVIGYIRSKGFNFDVKYNFKNTIIGFIRDIKVDFVRHDYPLIVPPKTTEGITYLSLEDIAAMKLNAISTSGKRLKDFIDIYFLLEHFCMEDLIGFYAKKYPNFNPLIALKSVNYFDDLDPDMDPPRLRTPLPLEAIKARIHDAVLHSRRRYDEL